MNKKLIALMLCLFSISLVSCDKEKDGAIEYLKAGLKSPSSFKEVETKVKEKNDYSIQDTLYHVDTIIGEYGKYVNDWLHIDSVYIDQIKVVTTKYPDYKIYTIKYDADNSFGASIRDVVSIYYCDGNYYKFEDFVSKFGTEEAGEPISYGKMVEFKGLSLDGDNKSKWYDRYDIFGIED